jgi:hypothetical protein
MRSPLRSATDYVSGYRHMHASPAALRRPSPLRPAGAELDEYDAELDTTERRFKRADDWQVPLDAIRK